MSDASVAELLRKAYAVLGDDAPAGGAAAVRHAHHEELPPLAPRSVPRGAPSPPRYAGPQHAEYDEDLYASGPRFATDGPSLAVTRSADRGTMCTTADLLPCVAREMQTIADLRVPKATRETQCESRQARDFGGNTSPLPLRAVECQTESDVATASVMTDSPQLCSSAFQASPSAEVAAVQTEPMDVVSVERVREMQAAHDAEIAALQQQLASSRSEYSQLEHAFQNLRGALQRAVTTPRSDDRIHAPYNRQEPSPASKDFARLQRERASQSPQARQWTAADAAGSLAALIAECDELDHHVDAQ